MSNTASSFGHVPSATLFGRFLANVDRLLMASARASIRNGDLPRVGTDDDATSRLDGPGFPGPFFSSHA